MSRRLAAGLLLALSFASVLPAQAGQGWRDGGWAQAQPQRPYPPQYDRRNERQYAPPDRRYEGERQYQPQGPQRMTPDERRQLRRDLHDANRDLYQQRRDGRR